MTTGRRTLVAQAATAVLVAAIWWTTPPEGLTLQAWRLFAVFAGAIFSVVVGALPILTASVLAAAIAVLTRLLPAADAYAGFGNGTILLIVVAFLVANAVVKCGLGTRAGHLIVSRFGRSTLGLSYSIFVLDAIIAPAFPSNTARSGVLYPLRLVAGGRRGRDAGSAGSPAARSVPDVLGSGQPQRLVGALAHGDGCQPARRPRSRAAPAWRSGSVAGSSPRPCRRCARWSLLPLLLYRVIGPEVTSTPEAPAAARQALAALGPMSRHEWTVLLVFVGMVALWASAATFDLDSTAIAFLGLGVLLATGVITLEDIATQGDVLATFIWFAVLFTISSQLNELGFMGYLGRQLAAALGGLAAPTAGLILVAAYILLHYLFVSQTAHLLALFGVFLGVGVKLGVNPSVLAFQLLFATNYFSVITPQGSSANLLFAGSGYLSQGDLYRLGAITTAASAVIYFVIGTAWLMLVAR